MNAPRIRLQSVQRIVSIPITRSGPSKREILTYYHFQIHDSHRQIESEKASRGTWVRWVQEKAVDTWNRFGNAPEGSWKLKVYRAGQRAVDRIDFEELALQGVDPALGPTVFHPDISGKGIGQVEKNLEGNSASQISLLYPPSVYSHETAVGNLRQLLSLREPRHRRGMWIWIAVTPLTFPFKFIPIIPNLPFFFCVWRAWSHYRAYRASQYLSKLIDNRIIVPEASETLDAICRNRDSITSASTSTPTPEFTADTSKSESGSELLLSKDDIPNIISGLELKSDSIADILRAIEQARMRFAKS